MTEIAAPCLRDRLALGERFLNGFCTLGSTLTAEIAATQRLGCVTIDRQHGLIGYDTALAMLQVIQGRGMPALCRVPGNDGAEIARMLDIGFDGIICPGIDTPEEAAALVEACLYPPAGRRSYGAARAASLRPGYAAGWNERALVLAMIGSREAVGNIEAILDVARLDGVYVAAADLSLAFGFGASQALREAELVDAVGRVRHAAAARGRIVGIHAGSAPQARQALKEGFQLVSLMTDLRIYAQALEAAVRDATPP